LAAGAVLGMGCVVTCTIIIFPITMSKRTLTELQSSAQHEGQAFPKSSSSGLRRKFAEPDDMGEFEDAWEDEIESDNGVDADAVNSEDST
jgi:ribosome assembly protein RRB1